MKKQLVAESRKQKNPDEIISEETTKNSKDSPETFFLKEQEIRQNQSQNGAPKQKIRLTKIGWFDYTFCNVVKKLGCIIKSLNKDPSNPTTQRKYFHLQKQSWDVFYKVSALKNFEKFTGKHLCQNLFFG